MDRCLDEGLIEFGHHAVAHDLAVAGDWEAVRARFVEDGLSPAKASDFTRELRDFHTLPASTLWITIARGRLWWTFAADGVEPVQETGRGARAAGRGRLAFGGRQRRAAGPVQPLHPADPGRGLPSDASGVRCSSRMMQTSV
ncbi:MAG TPA: hypothetical protein VFF66_05135 [Brevundimonas sp.]|nr:hypothetical protein [Brevundimonas sp.]